MSCFEDLVLEINRCIARVRISDRPSECRFSTFRQRPQPSGPIELDPLTESIELDPLTFRSSAARSARQWAPIARPSDQSQVH
jgi:hypothetical protein